VGVAPVLAELGGEALALLVEDVGEDHARAFEAEAPRVRCAHPSGRARDEGDPSVHPPGAGRI
jgi:hypothetical protein